MSTLLMIALLDNTVLSNFSAVRRPDLVRLALGNQAATVEQVFAELQAGIRLKRLPPSDWSWLPVLHLTDAERPLYERLNEGEAACLAMAYTRGYRVFTDDRDAREIARQMRIPISDTIGLLVRLVDRGSLSVIEANDLLRSMMDLGYRSPIARLEEIL